MAIEEGLFWTQDGERLFYRFERFSHTRNPIILLHGHGEHSGRYLKFFKRLESLQYPIAIFDLRGCGQSSGERADVARFEDFLADVSSFVEFLGERYEVQPPIQLFGHSLGGLIALAWACENPQRVSKLVLSSPLLGMHQEPLLKILVPFLYRIWPGWVVRNPVHPPFLTHDQQEVERYRQDPLILKRITVRMVYEMQRFVSRLRKGSFYAPFPVYILMAGKDFVVNPVATKDFFSNVQTPRKELEVFEDFFHEIFNEKGQERAFEKLSQCLGQ